MALDATTIVQSALDLLKDEGLAGVTVRKLSTRLGVKAPAIYWRFADKRELLDAVAEAVLQQEFADLTPWAGEPTWRNWYADLLRRLRTAMLSYPDGARLVTAARPTHAPTLGRITEYALQAAKADGEDLAEAATAVFAASRYTFGHVIEEQDSPAPTDPDTAARIAEVAPVTAEVLDLGRALDLTPDRFFDNGLSLILTPRRD